MKKGPWWALGSSGHLRYSQFSRHCSLPYRPDKAVSTPYAPPNLKDWLGTDNLGQDVLSQIIYGSRISLLVGLVVALAATFIGTIVGVLSGYLPRRNRLGIDAVH